MLLSSQAWTNGFLNEKLMSIYYNNNKKNKIKKKKLGSINMQTVLFKYKSEKGRIKYLRYLYTYFFSGIIPLQS